MSDDTVIRVENLGKNTSLLIRAGALHGTADVLADGVKSLGRQLLTPLGKGSLPQPMKSSGR